MWSREGREFLLNQWGLVGGWEGSGMTCMTAQAIASTGRGSEVASWRENFKAAVAVRDVD